MRLKNIKAFMIDLDGVVYFGNNPAIGVPERAENPPVLDAVCAPLAETIE